MLSTMMNMPLTLDLLLERAGTLFRDVQVTSRRPDHGLHHTTYGEIHRRARRLASALQNAGVQPGDRVATLMWNHYAHVEAYFGIPAMGGVLHTLNLRLHAEDLAYIVNHARDRILLLDDCLLPLYEQFKHEVRFERVIVFGFDGAIAHAYEDYDAFLQSGADDYHYPRIDEQAACGMCYTSGTTGRPKGVVYGHRSSVLHALGLALPDVVNLSMHDTVMPIVPMFHANAWGLPYAAAMVGARLALPGPHLDAISLLDLLSSTRTTLAAGVPTIWMSVLRALQAEPERWALVAGMRMLVGGAATPASLIDAFDKLGLKIMAAWGLTETSPIGSVSTLRPELGSRPAPERTRYRAKAGMPAPLVEVRVVNDHGIAPWDGQTVGELECRGPWVTASYYDRPDAADRFSDDGWFRTGDVAYLTPEGYISITDRAKDLIKSGGEWISSQDLENELMAHPAVAEAVVIAVPHERWTERPLAVVVRKPGTQVSSTELHQHLEGKFAKWWLPDGYEFIDQIPRTSTGKFQKLKVREMFADWQPAIVT